MMASTVFQQVHRPVTYALCHCYGFHVLTRSILSFPLHILLLALSFMMEISDFSKFFQTRLSGVEVDSPPLLAIGDMTKELRII